jgi:hypothetical protein
VREAQAELGFELELVEIDGDPELEERYRERIPVVEIDGETAFTYFVDPDGLRRAWRFLRQGRSDRWQNRDDLSQGG